MTANPNGVEEIINHFSDTSLSVEEGEVLHIPGDDVQEGW